MAGRRFSLVSVAIALVAFSGGLAGPSVGAQGCPELAGWWAHGPAYAVAVSGNHTFVGSGPTLLIVEVAGGYAYVAAGDSLQILDVSDPAAPSFVGGI